MNISYSLLLLTLPTMLLAGCDFNPGADRTNCEGFIENLRTLPDTTLVVNGEPLTQELEGAAPFFRHTAGRGLSYLGSSSSLDIAIPNIVGDSATIFRITPAQVGTATITVRAVESRCMLNADFSFNVEVVAAN